VPLWGIPVALRYAPRRVACVPCAGVHVESMPSVRGKQQMTYALLVTLATWARALPWVSEDLFRNKDCHNFDK